MQARFLWQLYSWKHAEGEVTRRAACRKRARGVIMFAAPMELPREPKSPFSWEDGGRQTGAEIAQVGATQFGSSVQRQQTLLHIIRAETKEEASDEAAPKPELLEKAITPLQRLALRTISIRKLNEHSSTVKVATSQLQTSRAGLRCRLRIPL